MSNHIIGQLFEENYNAFKTYLRHHYRTLNEYDVEDIIQQTIIKLLYKGEDITGITNLSSYMYSSLSNSAKDYFKKYDRVELHESYSEHFNQPNETTTEDIILLKELKQVIKKTLYEMDEKYRYIFIETEIKGRSYKSIMNETGIKLGTLLSRKNRAKKKLQTVIYDYLNNIGD